VSKLLFEGLKVLDVGSWIAGPVATTILADFGADVIKIERPNEGDQYRILSALPGYPDSTQNYMWETDARNKRDLGLNLKSDEGRDILVQLIEKADVYVTNQPFPLRRQLKLEYEDVKAINPSIIYASLTAYGEQGPEKDKEGFDLVAYWARSGLMDLVRDRDGRPAIAVPGMGDHPSAVSLYASIVTALLHREKTGEGSKVHTSLLANGVWSAACIASAGFAGGNYVGYRAAKRKRAFAGTVYQCADDRWLQITMVRSPDELVAFFSLLDLETLFEDPRFETPESFAEHTEALVEIVQERLLTRRSDDWLADFAEAGLNIVRIGIIEELVDDKMVYANNIVAPPTDPKSDMPYVINHPLNIDAIDRVGAHKAPDIGEHSDAILTEMGLSSEQIEQLRAKGVIQ
jgi:crotonobetainyl-CoA:carnitine CoA-transferase CaiB-like acyl-CoA transferase